MENDPIDVVGIPETFFDGIHEIKIIEGVVRIALYSRHNGDSAIVARLAIPISELPEVIQALVISLTEVARELVKPVGRH